MISCSCEKNFHGMISCSCEKIFHGILLLLLLFLEGKQILSAVHFSGRLPGLHFKEQISFVDIIIMFANFK